MFLKQAFFYLAIFGLFYLAAATDEDDLVKIKIEGLEVQMGADGTNDHVTAQICTPDNTELSATKMCCATRTLDSRWSNDWSCSDHEVWGKKWMWDDINLGCGSRIISSARFPELILNLYKTGGTDGMFVQDLKIMITTLDESRSGNYECGSIDMIGDVKVGLNNHCTLKWG